MPGLQLRWQFATGDPLLDETTTNVRWLRTRTDRLSAATSKQTAEATQSLVARGSSVRDVATALGISPQRISQITRRTAG
jgi:hypothetical protein